MFHQFGIIFRTDLYHHPRIRPARTPIGRRHPVDNNLLRATRSRNDKPARAHTERIYTSPVCLRNETIFGCRKIFSPALLTMILYLVDQLLGMFQTDSHGNTFCFDRYLLLIKILIDIASRMACSQDNRAVESLSRIGFYTDHFIILQDQGIHTGLEIHFASTADNLFTDIFYYTR